MKIFILIFILSINSIESRFRNDDIYELDDLLKKYDRYNYRPNKPYIPDLTDDDDNNNGDEDDDQYIPSSYQHKKLYPSRKKVLNENEESENDDTLNELLLPKTTTTTTDVSDTSLCFNDYTIRSEQLIKVKELKNGAHMIRYTLIDKRLLSSNHNIKDNCMLDCCSEKNCDLAMLSEQPTHVNKFLFYLIDIFN